MTDEAHHKTSGDDPSRLRTIVLGLAAIYVMTFVSGFLQDTPFNFFNYIFFFLLFLGGILLIKVNAESETTGASKWALLTMGISATLLFVFYVGYELLRLNGFDGLAASVEGLLYLLTLVFWILVIVSLISIRRLRGRGS